MGIKLDTQTKHFIGELGKRGNVLQIVAAEALNESAGEIERDYKTRLKRKQRIRTKFTLNSTKTFRANPIRKSGEPRKLSKINAVTGVKKMRGGKEHYLAKLERGVIQRGNSQTRGRVPIPLTAARTGRNEKKPIASMNRLLKAKTQTLQAGGRNFGARGDGFRTPGQRFAILYNYKRKGGSGLAGDLTKPFFFTDNENNLSIFRFVGGRARKMRTLEKSSAKTRKRPNFETVINAMKPARIQERFIKLAKRKLGR